MGELKSKQFPLRLTPSEKKILKALAAKEERSMNDIIVRSLRLYAKNRNMPIHR